MSTLLEKLQSRQEILADDALFDEVHAIKVDNEVWLAELNTGYKTADQAREQFGRIIGQEIDDSVTVNLPIQTDFGRHIRLGKGVFINKEVFFVDLGGITIEDKVLIGPRATLITVNHILDPAKRRGLTVKPIHIKENA